MKFKLRFQPLHKVLNKDKNSKDIQKTMILTENV